MSRPTHDDPLRAFTDEGDVFPAGRRSGETGCSAWTQGHGRQPRPAIAPFAYGRRDEVARAHHAAEDEQRNSEAAAVFGAEGAYDPGVTRTALARFAAPVLLLAGEVDPGAPPRATAEFTGLFPYAELVVQPGAGHFPWLDDPDRFVAATASFLG